jgi:hypothetical protein
MRHDAGSHDNSRMSPPTASPPCSLTCRAKDRPSSGVASTSLWPRPRPSRDSTSAPHPAQQDQLAQPTTRLQRSAAPLARAALSARDRGCRSRRRRSVTTAADETRTGLRQADADLWRTSGAPGSCSGWRWSGWSWPRSGRSSCPCGGSPLRVWCRVDLLVLPGEPARQKPTRRQLEVLRTYIRAGSVAAAYELGISDGPPAANAAQAAYRLGTGGLAAGQRGTAQP